MLHRFYFPSYFLLSTLFVFSACVEAVTLSEPVEAEAFANGESRQVELRFLRFDTKDFVQELTLEDIKARFPERILRETWLLDMDLQPLIRNALITLIATDPADVPQLSTSSQNMWELLNMTPASTVLDGTSLAPLLGVGEAIALGPGRVLADLLALDLNAAIITVDLTTEAVIKHVIGTHPNAQLRPGPVNAEHPDGLYPVTPGTLPVSLWDVVTDFAELPVRFGPAKPDPMNPTAPIHPGFIAGDFKFKATTPDFKMIVKVDLNALPYKGIDLTTGTPANINSTKSQITRAFDFSSDDWMQIEGLVPSLVVEEMTMAIYENPEFIASGTSRTPELGNSLVWNLPGWQFERLIAEVAVLKAKEIPSHCSSYAVPNDVDPPFEAVQVCIGQGDFVDPNTNQSCTPSPGDESCIFDPNAPVPPSWATIAIDDSVVLEEEDKVKPSFFWDILLEVAQVRLHDNGFGGSGEKLAEGEGNVSFTLKQVPVGITVDDLVSQIKANIQKNPAAMSAIAELLNENTEGEADFFYYIPSTETPTELQGDYLYFITPEDIENDEDGDPVRPYDYKNPGFFADAQLTEKISQKVLIDDDDKHEKVKIAPGDVLFTQDHNEQVYRINVEEKPSQHRIALDIKRVR